MSRVRARGAIGKEKRDNSEKDPRDNGDGPEQAILTSTAEG